MVLGKLPVPGRPTSLNKSRARAYCSCSRCGWGLFGHFYSSSILSLLFLPLFGRRFDLIDCFGFNGPFRQYFSLYRAVSQREGERGEKG